MGATHRFLAVGDESAAVFGWFRDQPDPPQVVEQTGGATLYFRSLGPLAYQADNGTIDVRRSPVVSIFRPSVKRGVFWTVGEVHFLSTPLRTRFPALHSLNRRFVAWLGGFDRVFDGNGSHAGEWDYHLEGGIRNQSSPVFALPQAMRSLREGRYFVDANDGEIVLEKVCRLLRLRGVECRPDA